MRERLLLGAALLLTGLVMPITGCSNPSGLDSITVTPSTESLNVGDNVQLTATGTYGNANRQSTQPVTTGVTWTSSAPAVASVVATTGAVTAAGVGTATITATAQGFRGPVTATATVTVGGIGTGTGGVGSLSVIAVLPSAQTLSLAGQTTQFTAVGTTTTGSTEYLTNSVTWTSSNPSVATIGVNTGLATAVGAGTVTITAAYTEPQAVITGIGTLTVSAGAVEQVTALSLTPSSDSLSASGETAQLIALATAGSTGLQENITGSPSLTWKSATPAVATVTAGGLVQGASAGTTTITALYTNPDNTVVTATASISVSATPAPEPIISLTIIPSSITVLNLLGTGNFLAVANYSTAPFVRDVTNSPSTTWLSSAPEIFPVDTNSAGNPGASAGTVTAVGNGSATIIAESTSPDGTIQTATATFNCPASNGSPAGPGNPGTPPTCVPGTVAPGLLVTLTVYNEGLNTTNWLVTAPSATGTQDVIHCGPGWVPTAQQPGTGSVCTATYPVGTTVTLTATQPAGATGTFGGWSYNCATITPNPSTAAGPNTCSITLDGTTNSNATIGAIFN